MKLSVFCSENKKHILPRLRLALDEYFIEYQSIVIADDYSMDEIFPSLRQLLYKTSSYIIIPSDQAINSQWLAFVSAYSNMNIQNTILLNTGKPFPQWLQNYTVCKDFDSLVEMVGSKTPIWYSKLQKEMAMVTLENKMREYSHESFIETILEGDRFFTGVFLEAGFDATKLSAKLVSPLGIAARKGYLDIAHILLEAGADINQLSTDRNNTPLMDAASEGHLHLVELFLEKGADLTILSKNGQSALLLATGNTHYECAELLIQAGADCEQKDVMGLSARKYAQLYQLQSLLDIMPPEPED